LNNKPITPAQCRAARALVDMEQAELARRAVVSRNVIIDFEGGSRTPMANNLSAIRSALEAAGVEFTDGDEPGVKLRKGHSA
jgi:predicted transcriptional regulator